MRVHFDVGNKFVCTLLYRKKENEINGKVSELIVKVYVTYEH